MTGDMGERHDLRPECAAVDDDLLELALGSLTGKQRVAALAHMESCARCSAEVDELSKAADQLLHLAPASEPPIGFEAGVFERLGLDPRPTRLAVVASAETEARHGHGGVCFGGHLRARRCRRPRQR